MQKLIVSWIFIEMTKSWANEDKIYWFSMQSDRFSSDVNQEAFFFCYDKWKLDER